MSRVSIIAGIRPKNKIGLLASAPDATNAESQPPLSEFDSQWGCAEWQAWHTANVIKYGATVANQKFITQFNQLSSVNSAYNFCKYNCDWAQYFGNYGIDVSDVTSKAACAAVTVVDAAGNVVTNTAQGVSSASGLIKYLLPLAVIIGGAYAIDKFVYPIFPKRKINGIKKKKK